MCKAIDDSLAVPMRTIGGMSLVISTVGAKALDEDKVADRQAFSATVQQNVISCWKHDAPPYNWNVLLAVLTSHRSSICQGCPWKGCLLECVFKATRRESSGASKKEEVLSEPGLGDPG
jgi:hypothetical protein